MPSPFFIIGASRSGTTLLRLMLNAHSSVYIPGEMNYFHWMDLRTDLPSWRIPRTNDRYRHQRGYELVYPFLARTRSALGSLVPSNS